MSMDLREQKFGIEIELTGLTRKRAAEVIGKYLGQEPHYDGGYYEEYSVRDEQGRKWKVMYDSSIVAVKKEPEIDTKEFQVEKVITLPSEQYAYFTQHLMKEHDFIKENVDLMYEKDGVWHCLLVAGEGMDEGVLVESEGSAYARYSAFVPFAQEIIRQYQDMQETQTDVMQMKM